MLGNKKKQKSVDFAFEVFGGDGLALARYDAAALPLNRTAVLEKSVEFFADPNPCAIHEGAVRMRMLAELEAFLAGKGAVELADLPEALQRYLNLEKTCCAIAVVKS